MNRSLPGRQVREGAVQRGIITFKGMELKGDDDVFKEQ